MKKCTVLLTEDDHEDAEFMRQALELNSFSGNIHHLSNGLQLLHKLNECKSGNTLPELIILDLNMPFKTGVEVLKEMNADPEYQKIPVAVVTASLKKEDEELCAKLGCQLYIRKPVRFNEYQQIGKKIVAHLRTRFPFC